MSERELAARHVEGTRIAPVAAILAGYGWWVHGGALGLDEAVRCCVFFSTSGVKTRLRPPVGRERLFPRDSRTSACSVNPRGEEPARPRSLGSKDAWT